eukprot:GFYU01002795.1.p1 GENE.GFYU01002795.1~~GFYU01002795.1.p1  ORF type:complete len:433 (+),score=110.10 GFYU01002795.1:41-1339(+)
MMKYTLTTCILVGALVGINIVHSAATGIVPVESEPRDLTDELLRQNKDGATVKQTADIEQVPYSLAENDHPVFVPEKDWKQILPGQMIPPGLDVRMNLSTGVKEARLLEGAPAPAPSQPAAVPAPPVPIANEDTPALEEPKPLTEDEKVEIHKRLEERMNAMTPEELKQMADYFGVSKSVENMMALQGLIAHPESTHEEVVDALEMLNDYVDQVDLARDFDYTGGLDLILHLLSNSDSEIRGGAAAVVATCTSNHEYIKNKVIQKGGLTQLINLLDPKEMLSIKEKAVGAIANILRENWEAQAIFPHTALKVLVTMLQDKGSTRLHRKIITLVADLVDDLEESNAPTSALGHTIVADHDWCFVLPNLVTMHTEDPSFTEQILQTLTHLAKACKSTFTTSPLGAKLGQLKVSLQSHMDEDDVDHVEYITSILK